MAEALAVAEKDILGWCDEYSWSPGAHEPLVIIRAALSAYRGELK
jgi:hypothetical protein